MRASSYRSIWAARRRARRALRRLCACSTHRVEVREGRFEDSRRCGEATRNGGSAGACAELVSTKDLSTPSFDKYHVKCELASCVCMLAVCVIRLSVGLSLVERTSSEQRSCSLGVGDPHLAREILMRWESCLGAQSAGVQGRCL